MADFSKRNRPRAYSNPNKRAIRQLLAAEACEPMARRMAAEHPDRFKFHPTTWGKFPDGTDKIIIGGYTPTNELAGEHVVLLCSFHNNDVTWSQFQVMIVLLQSFIESLTVVLPFYPVGTMERVVTEGEVATANTYAQMFSTLPSCGRPTRLMTYDIHTLQNRFYLSGATLASLHTTIPCLLPLLGPAGVDAVAFPDDGAAKRFKHMFDADRYAIIVCGKVRDGDKRVVTVQDGDATGRRVIVIDDLVQTGGTLYECGAKLLELGAASVSAFVAHGVFPRDAWRRFARGGDRDVFSKFYVTNSIPTTTDRLPKNDVFEVIDLTDRLVGDLLRAPT